MLKPLLTLIYTLTLLFSSYSHALDIEDLLKPEQAFKFSLSRDESNTLYLNWDIADGYYLYQKKIKASLIDSNKLKISDISFPNSETLTDQSFGTMQVFRGNIQVAITLTDNIDQHPKTMLKLRYQGCADAGLCYMPIKKKLSLNNLAIISTPTQTIVATPVISQQDSIAASLDGDNMLMTLISFFGFGLLLSFTPCVFPMIPILSGIIIGQGSAISTKKALSLSIVYVLAMASAYTGVGILAGLFGTNLQVWFQNPWILSSFAAIFVLLSFSMFGFYELQMPAAIQQKLNNVSNNQQSGSMISAAIMGFLSALIVGPCVTAPLIGALIYIGQTGDALLGGSALFAMSLGMGVPLVIIGASAGKLLPKSGQWMVGIKSLFGVLMLAVAIWLLSRIISDVVTQLLCAILIIGSAIYLGALKQQDNNTTPWQTFFKAMGILLLIYGTLLMIGAATGRANLLSPLANISSGKLQNGHNQEISFKRIKSLADLEQELAKASDNDQYVMLDFYADWCISCKEMGALTFSDQQVKQHLSNVVVLQADVTNNDDLDQVLLKQFDLLGPPAVLFFAPSKGEQKGYRVVGFMAADAFIDHLNKLFL